MIKISGIGELTTWMKSDESSCIYYTGHLAEDRVGEHDAAIDLCQYADRVLSLFTGGAVHLIQNKLLEGTLRTKDKKGIKPIYEYIAVKA